MLNVWRRSYNQILCTPIKKTYPLASLKTQEPLCRGAKERIRLMKKNEPKRDRNQEQVEEVKSPLEEIIREGARKLLQSAIEREIADYMESINGTGGRKAVVRNGFAPERSILTGIGPPIDKTAQDTGQKGEERILYQLHPPPLPSPCSLPRQPHSRPLPQRSLHRRLRRCPCRHSG